MAMQNRPIEVIEARIRTKIPQFVWQVIRQDESVLAAFGVSLFDHHRKHDMRHDRVVLTDERVIYYKTALIHKELGQMPYSGITEVHYNRGMIHGKVILNGANAGLTLRGIGNDDATFAERIISGIISGRRYVAAP